MLTPAFSVNTTAWVACCSSHSPNAFDPVKSTSRTSGRTARSAAIRSPSASAASVTRSASKPASASTSRATCTVIASGSTAPGCGLTTTGLPHTSDANRPGHEFQVGKVWQPMTSPTPRGTAVNVLSIRTGSPRPGFSHTADAGCRVISSYA